MDAIVKQFIMLCKSAYANWIAGGWCMPPMAINAIVMFALGIHVYLKLSKKGFQFIPERKWRQWVHHPEERKGRIGAVIDFATGGKNIKETSRLFKELRATEIAPFVRDLRVMGICATAAPLIGLLGTVTGMLSLFGALAHGSGGEKTMKLIAEGISEALTATQTGLMVALPGLIFHHYLTRQHEHYKAFMDRLETICTQIHHKRFISKTIPYAE